MNNAKRKHNSKCIQKSKSKVKKNLSNRKRRDGKHKCQHEIKLENGNNIASPKIKIANYFGDNFSNSVKNKISFQYIIGQMHYFKTTSNGMRNAYLRRIFEKNNKSQQQKLQLKV